MIYWLKDEKENWQPYPNSRTPLLSVLTERLKRQAPFPKAKGALCVCLAGAGGKTSLLWELRRECDSLGQSALVTATTHMMLTPRMLETGFAAGTPLLPPIREGEWIKCAAPDPDSLEAFRHQRDVLLIEADGSRRLPMKIPASHEPVIPEWSRIILVLCGLSALGQPPEKVCHRWALFGKNRETLCRVTPALMADVMREYYLEPLSRRFPSALVLPVWNQADTPALLEQARQTAALCGWSFQLIMRISPAKPDNTAD